MLTKERARRLLEMGEGYNVEYKERLPSKLQEVAVEVCAFANAAGGIVLLGVTDDNRAVGLELDNTDRSRLENTLRAIDPEPDFSVGLRNVGRQDPLGDRCCRRR